MNAQGSYILTVNAGSSSIKFDLFEFGESFGKIVSGAIENIGQAATTFSVTDFGSSDHFVQQVSAADHTQAATLIIDWLKQQLAGAKLAAIGHRVVHGGPKYFEPTIISGEVIQSLWELAIFDPEHIPLELKLVETLQQLFPGVVQIACFDTAFHHNLPTVARMLPIPRHYEAQGIRRYGFHGLSYTFLMKELRSAAGDDTANSHVVLAHLGSGASLAAVRNGQPIDTTMALTPAAGVPMSTRSGDLDPGLALYLNRSEGLTAEQFNDMVNFRSGLLGVSETTADMKQLLDQESQDGRAKDAVDMFCYQVKKSIGGLAAALGGIDTLVFSGGMGEKAPKVRAQICNGLEFIGIKLEQERNNQNDAVISANDSQATVRVIHTDEASTIADEVARILGAQQ